MKKKRVEFPSPHGYVLAGKLDLPDNEKPRAYALFAHCFTCTKDYKSINHISQSLTSNGLAVFRFDFTGLGDSEGDFAETTFSSNIEDLIMAADFMERTLQAPKLLIGHSLGGAAVLMAANKISSAKAVCTIAAPSDTKSLSDKLSSRTEVEREGFARVNIAGRPFTLKKQFFEDLEQTNMKSTINELRVPLIIFHSPVDNVVGIEHAAKIFTWAKHPKSFISMDNANHLLTNESNAKYTGSIISSWAEKYLQ